MAPQKDTCPTTRDGLHLWLYVAAGRVCEACRLVQSKGEYLDEESSGEQSA